MTIYIPGAGCSACLAVETVGI
ncbi:hypothetical protein FHC77_00245 [Atlantibacter hermannii]|nr:hypothetical protein [Atlantibacter hermannii]